ncbi:PrsW family glutamic-type intramembrane protease [Brachybacterium sp. J144]|uniref:PrsW family intramembrane metalloprotease n=1 Tax=unclassified Brachybacterium TaxID=2623841 RepID=UPI002E781475|nr:MULTISPECIES: PrsW family glutamic-type intramembrane protease [unclassified Brachybacterium]MEE1617648.1 PrsW family glutamic-type intramembrane protease [Brachybacterium sp. J153]MEE1651349.1 PrsW family glutamic-type intramembrane protease [Brachybacterium sp. J144]
MSITGAPSVPSAPLPQGAPSQRTGPSGPGSSGYGYDIERSDPRAPGRLGSGREPRRKRSRLWRIIYWALVFLGLAATAVVLYLLVILPLGFGTSLVAFTAALVPVALVFSAVWWLDRYTPQPRTSLVYAFVWGAIGSVGLTFMIGGAFQNWISPEEPADIVASFLGAVIQAPVIEEAMKSLGLVALLIWGRKYIAGPIDGVVYASLIAGGFAFTENILYFGSSFHQSQAAGEVAVFWQTFFLRGLLSPFAHVSFTALCGLGLGIAAERRSLMLYFGLGIGGLSLGMLLHALWNGSSFFLPVDPEAPLAGFLRYYVTVQVPIFALLVGIALFLRLRERRILRRRLSDYGRAGWFSPEEVDLLVAMGRRRRAERWAARHGAIARMAMRDFLRTAIALGMERHSVLHGRPTARTRAMERERLERLTADRRLIGALTSPVVRG